MKFTWDYDDIKDCAFKSPGQCLIGLKRGRKRPNKLEISKSEMRKYEKDEGKTKAEILWCRIIVPALSHESEIIWKE